MSCAGSAGGSQPPHRNHFRVPGQCEDDRIQNDVIEDNVQGPAAELTRKRGQRGTAKGIVIQKIRNGLRGAKIPIEWHPTFPKIRKSVGDYSPQFDSEIGRVMRTRANPNVETWEDVSDLAKQQMWDEIQTNFTNVLPIHRGAVEAQASETFLHWKSNLRRKIKAHRSNNLPGPPPKPENVELQEDWDDFIRQIDDPKFVAKCNQNKDNRSKSKYPSLQGRTPMTTIRYKRKKAMHFPLGDDPINVWEGAHKYEDGLMKQRRPTRGWWRLRKGLHRTDKLRMRKMS